jgi:hypothetical protein
MHPPANVQASSTRFRDCHQQTIWPWYCNVAPISWLSRVRTEAPQPIIFELGRLRPALKVKRLARMCDLVQRGEMPLTTCCTMGRR